jgi:hypothetical protein
MARLTIRRFDVIRTANIVAALYAVIVLIVGLVIILPLTLLAGAAAAEYGGAAFMGGVAAVLVFTVLGFLFYAAIGWVMTALVCALYNAVAGRIGGMRIEVEVEGPGIAAVVPAAAWGNPPPGYLPPGSTAPGGPPQPPGSWGNPQG